MTTLQSRLGGLLVLQLLIAAGLFWASQQQQRQSLQEPLLSFEKSLVDRVSISADDSTVTLRKNGDLWQLPELHQLPVSGTRLDDLLAKLADLSGGWPVATTASGRERFEVAADNYQRHLQLYQGEKAVAELFVGTSPGFRKVHVRRAGEDAVYAAALNSYELPASGSDWLDKSLLGAGDVSSIRGPDYALDKTDSGWAFVKATPLIADDTSQGNAPRVDTEKAEQLAAAVAGLQVQDVVDTTPAAEAVTLEVSGNDGTWTYRFMQVDDQYYVDRSDRQIWFSISKADFENITGIGLPQLALDTPDTGGDETADDPPSNS